jgi:hypothetical protein
MDSMPKHRTRTVEEAVDFCVWKIMTQIFCSRKFVWVKEGDKVQTPKGEVGQITSYSYFPDTDSYCIEVMVRSHIEYHMNPYDLQPIEEEEDA